MLPITCDSPLPGHGVEATCVEHTTVVEYLCASVARQILVIADSCFSGDLLGERREAPEALTRAS